MIFEIITAIFTLGLPVFGVSWYLLRRLFRAGYLKPGIDFKTLKNKLKGVKKDKSESSDFLHRNWMKFGGGFYGMTAVTTLLIIEVKDFLVFLRDFPGIFALFENGIINLIVDILVNQIQNFITAAIWFAHWGDGGGGMLTWALVAYLGYWLGLRAAERSLEEWQARWEFGAKHSKQNKNPPAE